jgi:hypothetical protein
MKNSKYQINFNYQTLKLQKNRIVMKKYIIFIFAIIFLISYCTEDKSPLKPGLYEGFALYTLSDSTVTATDAAQKLIGSLILADEPILTDEDLNHYKWNEHSLSLKSEANEKIRKIAKSKQTVFGIPFIVMAKKERIYLGAFWYLFSSVAPTFPTIDVTNYVFKDYNSNVLKIEKSWIEDQPDIRGDPRIYQVLQEAGVLIPY